MKEISTLIFDLGGVLTLPQDPAMVARLMSILGTARPEPEFRSVYSAERIAYDRGEIDARSYWGRVASRLGLSLDPDSIPGLVETDLAGWFRYRLPMIDLVARLKGRVRRVALLSNINAECAAYLDKSFPIPGLFDHRTLSCEIGLMKPEAAIYAHSLKGVDSDAGNALFVDDVEENVEGARRQGMSALRFRDETSFLAELEASFVLRP